MPNIEVFGIEGKGFLHAFKDRVQTLLKGAEYASEVVLTLPSGGSDVRNLQGDSRPYLRIAGTRAYLERHKADIKWRLRSLGMGIEWLVLDDFTSEDVLARMTTPD